MKLDLPTVIFALLVAKGGANQVPLTTDSAEDIDELERKWGYNVNSPPLPLTHTIPIANVIPHSGHSRASPLSATSPTLNA